MNLGDPSSSRALRVSWSYVVTAASLALGACALPPPALAPEAPKVEAKPRPAAVELPPPIKSALAELPAGVPGASEVCVSGVTRSSESASAASCDEVAALDQLEAALADADAASRDLRLARLEACTSFTPGWLRALRAELTTPECADALVAPFLERAANVRTQRQMALALGVEAALPRQLGSVALEPPLDVEQTLVGLALGARLRRLVAPPPAPPSDATKEAFLEYFKLQLEPWVRERASAIHSLALQASRLQGYGRAVAAIESAVADLNFVQAARDVPLPKEMAADPQLREAYYAALDEALEPRKARGRDAALVGLRDFASLGVIKSERIDRGRSVLARSYAGHRIDALDGLLLPALPELKAETREQRLAMRLPTFFAQHVLGDLDPTDVKSLRALLEQGLYPKARAQLDSGALSYGAQRLYARALVHLGQRYWRASDFVHAAQVAAVTPAQGQSAEPENLLLQALGEALGAGPVDAAQMMLGGPLLPEGVGNVTALDKLAEQPGEVAGMAAYDAAYILAFLPPQKEVAQFWRGIAKRYELAAARLKQPNDARDRAKNARETARAVRE
ncbi:MAG: hypothetical protein RJA70_3643 [Pseudomonadota bacterium]|jgi:hypothetical protein